MKSKEADKIRDLRLPGPLPRWEQKLAWAVWLSHSAIAFIIAYYVSNVKVEQWIKHWMQPSSYVSGWRVDQSDAEWSYYRQTVARLILDYSIHSFAIFLAQRIFNTHNARYAMVVIGFFTQIHMSSFRCVLVLYTFALLVTTLSAAFRSKLIPWVFCILFITRAAVYVPFSLGGHIFYREFNIYLYGAIKILNLCLFLCKNPQQSYRGVFVESLLYYAYLPYSMTLIVLFEDFREQFQKKEQNYILKSSSSFEDYRPVLSFGLRLAFWFFFTEFFLHFIYANALFNSPFTIINGLNAYEACSIAYVAGQFFHVKYVVIFGIPSLFSYIDGMKPPPPPICISRVSLYSRMWRHFDAGLYQFLKHQVYIPIMTPKLSPILSVTRNLSALAAVFGVVLAWHGTRRHYLAWVTLSAIELTIERIGSTIWKQNWCQEIRGKLGENFTRRVIATLMLLTVTPGDPTF
ncbi:unnamed protein product [Caenorhabditis auriculariae]|uniref:Uncharacterized protein n=1 Tax=Caenorhabditis auriculariae TaxID=2777116 RepID=A0A8S1HEI3_9PELO|nr:unnamed protein product [Caenorhabditis auriculariae]